MESKLASHVDALRSRDLLERMVNGQARGAFVNDNPPFIADITKRLPKARVVTRHWDHPAGDDARRMGVLDDPLYAAESWWHHTQRTLRDLRTLGADLERVYFRAVNEPVFYSKSDYEKLAQFEVHRMRILEDNGLKGALFGFATGVPRIADDTQHVKWADRRRVGKDIARGYTTLQQAWAYVMSAEDDWSALYPALESAHKGEHLIDVHEYWPAFASGWYGDNQDAAIGRGEVVRHPKGYRYGWLAFRYRRVWGIHCEPNGWVNLKFVATEIGSDMVGTSTNMINYLGTTPGGWRDMLPVYERLFGDGTYDAFLDELKWWDYQAAMDPYLLWGSVFVDGTGRPAHWGHYNIDGEFSKRMYEYMEEKTDGNYELG